MEQDNSIVTPVKLLIVSDRFVPAFLAQTESFYLLGKSCGYVVKRFLNPEYREFLDNDIDVLWNEEEMYSFHADVAIFSNISVRIPKIVHRLRRGDCKSCYILHEPYSGMHEMRKEKSTFTRAMLRTILDAYISKKVDRVLLPSKTALICYREYYRRKESTYSIFPVMFPELSLHQEKKRVYFSFVGSFSSSHNAEGFIAFMHYAYKKKLDITFRICTRTDITKYLQDEVLIELQHQNRLLVCHGQVLTDTAINEVYRESICVWTLYAKSMQSGVLGQAYMMETPVIASRVGSFEEVVQQGETGELIDCMEDMDAINRAFYHIKNNIEKMEMNIRKVYLEEFYYKSQQSRMEQLIAELVRMDVPDRSKE